MNRHERRAQRAVVVRDNRGRTAFEPVEINQRMLADFPACQNIRAAWKNATLSVQVYERAPYTHLMIRRHDERPVHSWGELLAVVHELYPGRWAFEVYPPAGEVIDQANLYHLWVLPQGEDTSPAVIRHGEPFGDAR